MGHLPVKKYARLVKFVPSDVQKSIVLMVEEPGVRNTPRGA